MAQKTDLIEATWNSRFIELLVLWSSSRPRKPGVGTSTVWGGWPARFPARWHTSTAWAQRGPGMVLRQICFSVYRNMFTSPCQSLHSQRIPPSKLAQAPGQGIKA